MIDWREPYKILLAIADSPTFDDMVSRWEGFQAAAKRFGRATYSYRRGSEGRKWHGAPTLRSDVRSLELKLSMQELADHVCRNPVFGDPRARDMKLDLIEVANVNWDSKPP
jgi:hypothetical protein